MKVRKQSMSRYLYVLLTMLVLLFSSGCSENSTLTSTVSAVNYVVCFETMGGSAVDSVIVQKGATIQIPTVTREGYTLEGWYTSINSGITLDEKWSFLTSTVNNDITLYANWTINQYTITFDSNGGTPVESVTANYYEELNLPESPSRQGYIFQGWFSDSEFSTPFSFALMPASNYYLYAYWTAELYTLTFNTGIDLDIDSTQLAAGDLIPLPDNPTAEGLVFDGWTFLSGEKVIPNESVMPAENIVIYARWHNENINGSVLIVHYYRFDGDYTSWNLWLWPSPSGFGTSYNFDEEDSFGVYATVDLSIESLLGVSEFGFIVRLGNWVDKDCNIDRYFVLMYNDNNGIYHIYLVEGVIQIFYSESSATDEINSHID